MMPHMPGTCLQQEIAQGKHALQGSAIWRQVLLDSLSQLLHAFAAELQQGHGRLIPFLLHLS